MFLVIPNYWNFCYWLCYCKYFIWHKISYL